MTTYKQPDFFRKPSKTLTEDEVAIIKQRLLRREFQHRIAADFDVNPGRISEIKTGKAWRHVSPT